MDEIRLIRRQLVAERERAASIVQICTRLLRDTDAASAGSGEAVDAFRQASLDYLRRVLASFEGRDARLRELTAQWPAGDSAHPAVERALSGGGSREATGKLESALGPSASSPTALNAWQEFAAWFDTVWRPRRAAVEALLDANPRVADWRLIGAIDADWIVEERALYERVRRQQPSGHGP